MEFNEFMEKYGYKVITTFWQDFTNAEAFGLDGVRETFETAFDEWKTNYKYLTELVLVLNNKTWYYHKDNKQLAALYNELYNKASAWADNNLTGPELQYYLKNTD